MNRQAPPEDEEELEDIPKNEMLADPRFNAKVAKAKQAKAKAVAKKAPDDENQHCRDHCGGGRDQNESGIHFAGTSISTVSVNAALTASMVRLRDDGLLPEEQVTDLTSTAAAHFKKNLANLDWEKALADPIPADSRGFDDLGAARFPTY